MSWDFWHGKKVFLTGHTGFKGSWLALWLARLGARVCGYALPPPTTPSLFELASVDDVVESKLGDIRDHELLAGELARFGPDIVFHLAAQSVVLRAYENPLETYATNVIGTVSLLEAVRRTRAGCTVVNVTTDKVYKNRGWIRGYRENDQLGGRDPYASSKACAELVAHSFRESFFTQKEGARVGLANARAGNVIGGGDWTAWQLIPDAVLAFSQGRPVVLRHPEATRPWQHVLDCLSGYLALAQALHGDAARYSEDWNFGPPDAHMRTVSNVVGMLAKHWGVEPAWVRDPGEHRHEDMVLHLDSQKANQRLAWGCRLPLEQALAWTAEWYRGLARGANARALCDEQLDGYMELGYDRI